MKYALRQVFAVVMLGLLVALLATVAVAIVLAVVAALVAAATAGGAWAAGAGIVITTMAAALGLLAARRRRRPESPLGVPVMADEQPLLWVEVNRVAEGLGTRAPDELFLVPEADVTASEQRSWLGLRPGARRLQVGLPLLAGLTERQLRAVITHEVGRRWGSVSLDRVIHRGQEILGRVVASFGADSRPGKIFGRYGDVYLAVSGPISRKYEVEQDLLSAELAGNGAAAAALHEFAVLRSGWAGFVNGYAEPAAALGRRPHDVFAGFASFLDSPDRRAQLVQEVDIPSPTAAVRGSQVSLGDRLAAIASLPEDDMRDTSGPAVEMLRDPDGLIGRVEEFMFSDSGLVPAPWEDIVPEAGRAAACEDALQLARLGHAGGLGTTLSVANIVELVSHGLVDEMVRPMLADGASPESERALAGRLVTGFLATAAIESGTASYRFDWAAPRLLVDDQGVVDDLPQLVDAALADQGQVHALELWLESHRVGHELELGADLAQAVSEDLQVAPADSPIEHVREDPTQGSGANPAADPRAGTLPLLVPVAEGASI